MTAPPWGVNGLGRETREQTAVKLGRQFTFKLLSPNELAALSGSGRSESIPGTGPATIHSNIKQNLKHATIQVSRPQQ